METFRRRLQGRRSGLRRRRAADQRIAARRGFSSRTVQGRLKDGSGDPRSPPPRPGCAVTVTGVRPPPRLRVAVNGFRPRPRVAVTRRKRGEIDGILERRSAFDSTMMSPFSLSLRRILCTPRRVREVLRLRVLTAGQAFRPRSSACHASASSTSRSAGVTTAGARCEHRRHDLDAHVGFTSEPSAGACAGVTD